MQIMTAIALLASRNYITVNKDLIKAVGLEQAIIIGELASESYYWAKEGKLEEGFFFSTIENIEENTGIKEKKQRAALNALQSAGIIEMKLKGIPAKRYIRIDEEKLLEVLNNSSGIGETSSAEMAELDTPNWRTNNNKYNKNNTTKKERKKASFDALLKDYINDHPNYNSDELRELLQEWLKVRKAKRAAMTDRAIELNLKKLDEIAKDSSMSINEYLKEVICRGWAAFFVIKQYGSNEQPKQRKDAEKMPQGELPF